MHVCARNWAELWPLPAPVCEIRYTRSVIWVRVPAGAMMGFYGTAACGSLSVLVGSCKFLFA